MFGYEDENLRYCGQPGCPGAYPEVGFGIGCGCPQPASTPIVEDVDPEDEFYPPLTTEIPVLIKGILAVGALMDESKGVAGLHHNGDVAPWNELLQGGKYETWLEDFSEALEVALALRPEVE